jgi:hypothetical protein
VKKGHFIINPFFKGGFLIEKGRLRNRPFFRVDFLTSQPRSVARQQRVLFLHRKHARKAYHRASQNKPLIMKKGPFCNRPFFQRWFSHRKGTFEKPPFFQGPIFLAISKTHN